MNSLLTVAARLKHGTERVVRNRIRFRKLQSYLGSDRRPWRRGYHEYKVQYLTEVISKPDMLQAFWGANTLPDGYGFRLDARVVEIPWVLARLEGRQGRLLDAGSSLNHEFVLRSRALSDKEVTIVTLAPEERCYWMLNICYVYEDLRGLYFQDGCFDIIVCISSIEHVGMDNTRYAGAKRRAQPGDVKQFLVAVKELKRVLKPDGVLYMTFPFGQYENHGWFQQFDSELMDRLVEEFGPSHLNETIFRYHPEGWKLSDRAACLDCRFFDVHTSKYFDPQSTIDFPEDCRAGEQAVACLELCK